MSSKMLSFHLCESCSFYFRRFKVPDMKFSNTICDTLFYGHFVLVWTFCRPCLLEYTTGKDTTGKDKRLFLTTGDLRRHWQSRHCAYRLRSLYVYLPLFGKSSSLFWQYGWRKIQYISQLKQCINFLLTLKAWYIH